MVNIMNKFYSEEERVNIAKQQYEELPLGKKIIIDGGKTVGYVSQINDKPTGEQSFVITDIYVPHTASYEERSKVKEVTVLYRGSTSPDKFKTEFSDIYQDWVVNNAPLTTQILSSTQGKPTPQLMSSAQTLKNVLALYPNSQAFVYGHSLGSMTAQYSLADLPKSSLSRIGGGFFYQGPNLYSTLTLEQQKIVDKLNSQHKLYNYVDTKDLVPIGYGDGKPTVGHLIYVDSKKAGSLIDQHNWGGYQFKDGRIVTDKEGAKKLITYHVNQQLRELSELEQTFLSSGGGKMSSSQEIYLDAAQALALTEGMKLTLQDKIAEVKKNYMKEIEDAETLWTETLEGARIIGSNLSENERLDSLANGGATVTNILDKPKSKAEESLHKLNDIENDYDVLLAEISQAIQTQIETDEDLARQLGRA